MKQQNVERVSQLTPLQHGWLFEELRRQGSSRMIFQTSLELHGKIRPDLLRAAWLTVVRRHPILRTSFHYERLDTPVQVTRSQVDLPWRALDWRGQSLDACRSRLDEFLVEDRRHPFELTRAPLFRLAWLQLEDELSWLVWSVHPLLVDGWSAHLVLADVSRCHRELTAGRAPDAAPPRPFWEYIGWLRRHRGNQDSDEFWRSRLAGLPAPVLLGDREATAEVADVLHEEIRLHVTDDVARRLGALGRRYRVTTATLVYAAWAVTLGRYTDRDDVVFGGIVSGRDPDFDGVDDLVGVFVNNLPVRARVGSNRTLADWLVEFQTDLVDARRYSHVPLTRMQRCSELPNDAPLFESMVDFSNYPVRRQWTDGGDLQVSGLGIVESPPYPLALVGSGDEQGLRLKLSYGPERFTRAAAASLAELVTAVLGAMADRPEQRLAELPAWTSTIEHPTSPPVPVVPAPEATPEPVQNHSAESLLDIVTTIWARALDLPEVHQLVETSNFFDVGGHSLVAIRLVSRLRSVFDVDFTITDLFGDPTVGGSARTVHSLLAGDRPDTASEPIPHADRDAALPASFAQERLWFVDQLDRDAPANNLTITGRFRCELDVESMHRALRRLLDRHEVLRTCLRERDGVIEQVIQPSVDSPLHTDDLSHLPPDQAEQQAHRLLMDDATRRFELGADVPILVRMIRLGTNDTVLGICLHHVVCDGWSFGVLTGDLAELYAAELAGQPATLRPLPVQYADFSHWQRQRFSGDRLTELAEYWRTQLSGAPDKLRLTATPARSDTERTDTAGTVEIDLTAELPALLRTLTTAEAVTPFMVLVAAYGVLLARRSGRDDIVIGTPTDDRDHPNLEPLIGLFVNTQVLRLPMGGDVTFRELLARVRQVCLGALAHRDLPFEKLVSMVSHDRAADRMPLVQVSFLLGNVPGRPLALSGTTASPFPIRRPVPRFELTTVVYDVPEGMRCALSYAEDIYQRDFAEQLVAEYVDVLHSLVSAPDRPVVISPGAGTGGLPPAPGTVDDNGLHDASRALLRSLSSQ